MLKFRFGRRMENRYGILGMENRYGFPQGFGCGDGTHINYLSQLNDHMTTGATSKNTQFVIGEDDLLIVK